MTPSRKTNSIRAAKATKIHLNKIKKLSKLNSKAKAA